MAEKTRYSDEELQEFKELILEKLEMISPTRRPRLKYWRREPLFFPKRKPVD